MEYTVARTANVEIGTNGETPESAKRAALSALIPLEFDVVIKDYLAKSEGDRSVLIRESVARTLRDNGYTVEQEWLERTSRKDAAAAAGQTRKANNAALRKTANAAEMFMKFLDASGQGDLASKFAAFLSGDATDESVPATDGAASAAE